MYDNTERNLKRNLDRISAALESIAASLERLSLPEILIKDDEIKRQM
jgi:hypothetical protein